MVAFLMVQCSLMWATSFFPESNLIPSLNEKSSATALRTDCRSVLQSASWVVSMWHSSCLTILGNKQAGTFLIFSNCTVVFSSLGEINLRSARTITYLRIKGLGDCQHPGLAREGESFQL